MQRRARIGVLLAVVLGLAVAGCGDGEDRPGVVTEEGGSGSGSGSGSASGSGSGTHSGSASGSGTHTGSSSGTGAEAAFSKSAADTVVSVTFRDFAFDDLASTIKGPKVFFEATNKGPEPHELEILDSDGKALGEIEEREVGKTGTLAIELKPGQYTAQCLVEKDGKPHTDLGMKVSFMVT